MNAPALLSNSPKGRLGGASFFLFTYLVLSALTLKAQTALLSRRICAGP